MLKHRFIASPWQPGLVPKTGRLLGLIGSLAMAAGAAEAAWNVTEADRKDLAKMELTFVAYEQNTPGQIPKVAFIKDLGKTMKQMFTDGQANTGVQYSWYLGGTDDAEWSKFLNTEVTTGTKVDPAKVRWAVFAAAQDVSVSQELLEPGSIQLFTTNEQGTTGSATKIKNLSNVTSEAITNPGPRATEFYSFTKPGGTLTTAENGSVVLTVSQGDAFPWPNQLSTTAQLNFGVAAIGDISNLMGKSSWFYKLTTSDPFDGTVPVTIDEFDNLTNDAFWGLAAATATDKAGQYFLSYNLGGTTTTLEAKNGYLASNNFARMAGIFSLSSASGRSDTVLDMTTNFLRGFAAASKAKSADDLDPVFALAFDPDAVTREVLAVPSPVPEAGTALTFGVGLAALAGLAVKRRRDARAASRG